MKATLLLAALGLPTLALAQSAPFAPHAYLGAGVSVYNNGPLEGARAWRYTSSTGPLLLAGYQFSPRLAVQASPAVQWDDDSNQSIGYQTSDGQPLTTFDSRSRRTRLTVPLLLRVTLTDPASRLHLDGLAGAAWLHTNASYAATQTAIGTGTVVERESFTYVGNSTLLTLAPAVRYGLGRRLEVALTLPVHYDLRRYEPGDYTEPPSFGERLRFQPQLSACYVLGSR